MKKKATKKSQEFRNVISVMEDNLSNWNHLTELRKSYDVFLYNNKKLEDLLIKANQKLDAVFENKMLAKNNLIVSLQPLLDVTGVYAKDHKKSKLAKKVSVDEKELKSSSDKKLIKLSSFIVKELESFLSSQENKDQTPAIKNYGIDQEKINDVKKELDNLKTLNNELKDKKAEKKKAKSKLKKLVKTNDKLLNKRFDKFLSLFRTENEDFYKAYNIARNNSKPLQTKSSAN